MIAALLALALVAATLLATLLPLLSAEPPATAAPDVDLARQRDALVAALRDVDLDHAMGKITAEDRDRLRAELEGRALRVMADLDTREPEPGTRA